MTRNQEGTTVTKNTEAAKVHTTIRIEGDEAERLKALAKDEDRSVSSVIRLAVRSYLKQSGA